MMDLINILFGGAKNERDKFLAIKILLILTSILYVYDSLLDGGLFGSLRYFLDSQLPLALSVIFILMKNSKGLIFLIVFLIIKSFYVISGLLFDPADSFYMFIYDFFPLYAGFMTLYYCGKNCNKIRDKSYQE
jgi:hypothetical protein